MGTNKSGVSERIKADRKRAGMTRKEYSAYFNIPVSTLNDWEYGRRKPPEYLISMMEYICIKDGLYKDVTPSERKNTYEKCSQCK